jgi:hypothetical protein
MTAHSIIKSVLKINPETSDIDLIHRVYGTILESRGQSLDELSALGVLRLVSQKKLPTPDSVTRMKRLVKQETVGTAPNKQKLRLF